MTFQLRLQVFHSHPLFSVESRVGAVATRASLRFPPPLIEPDVRISRIRLSDRVHRQTHGEAAFRFLLRLAVQLPRKRPDLARCFQAHRQSPHLGFFESAPEARVLPSTGIARLQRYYDPLRVSAWPPSLPRAEPPGLGFPHSPESPSLHAVPLTPVDPTGVPVGDFPVGAAFPDVMAGRRPRLHFRGLLRLHTCYGLQVRSTTQGGPAPAGSQGFGPVRPVAGLSRLSATRLTDNYLGGTSTHWRSAPLGRTRHSGFMPKSPTAILRSVKNLSSLKR